jgi:polyprenyl-phospho-N-acetylgalactosaminyl synthase
MSPVVLIPSYNESPIVLNKTVGEVLELGYRVIVIDDGSEPPCAEHLLSHANLSILRIATNQGQGAALQLGMDHALQQQAVAVVSFDADGQHNAADIARFLAVLEVGDTDIVIGSRFLDPVAVAAIPLFRRCLLWLGRWYIRLLTGQQMTDIHNGFRAMNAHALASIRLAQPRTAHATELVVQMSRHRLRWKEIPVFIPYTAYSLRKSAPKWRTIMAEWQYLIGLK